MHEKVRNNNQSFIIISIISKYWVCAKVFLVCTSNLLIIILWTYKGLYCFPELSMYLALNRLVCGPRSQSRNDNDSINMEADKIHIRHCPFYEFDLGDNTAEDM